MVTGASSGIGEATARSLAALGARVVITSEKQAELYLVARSIEDAGGCALPLAADFARPAQTAGLIARAEQIAGPLDILVNNAGLGMQAMIGDRPIEDLRHLFEVNFFAMATLCAEVLPRMSERGHGRIINISSAAGQFGSAGFGAYAASKAAMHVYTQALRIEAKANGVFVSEVIPVSVRTPFFENVRGESYQPKGVVLSVEDVAKCIVRCAAKSSPPAEAWPYAGVRLAFIINTLAPGLTARINASQYKRKLLAATKEKRDGEVE